MVPRASESHVDLTQPFPSVMSISCYHQGDGVTRIPWVLRCLPLVFICLCGVKAVGQQHVALISGGPHLSRGRAARVRILESLVIISFI